VCHGTLFQVPAPVAGYAFICTCHHVKGFQNCMRYIDGAFEYATYMNYFKYMQMQYLDIRSKASSRLTFDGHGMQWLSSASPTTIVEVETAINNTILFIHPRFLVGFVLFDL
jgi:hypothetical protein